eukprot:tig00020904_g15178.t1
MLLAKIRQLEQSPDARCGGYDDDFLAYEHQHWAMGPCSTTEAHAPRPSISRRPRCNSFPDSHSTPHAQLADARKALSAHLANVVRSVVQVVDRASAHGDRSVLLHAVSQHLEQYSKSYLALRALDVSIAQRVFCKAYQDYQEEARRLAHAKNRLARRWKPACGALEEESDEDSSDSEDDSLRRASSDWISERSLSIGSCDSSDSSPASSP